MQRRNVTQCHVSIYFRPHDHTNFHNLCLCVCTHFEDEEKIIKILFNSMITDKPRKTIRTINKKHTHKATKNMLMGMFHYNLIFHSIFLLSFSVVLFFFLGIYFIFAIKLYARMVCPFLLKEIKGREIERQTERERERKAIVCTEFFCKELKYQNMFSSCTHIISVYRMRIWRWERTAIMILSI